MSENSKIWVLKSRLDRLRRDLRLLTVVAGFATFVAFGVCLCYSSLLVDYLARMDVAQRGVFLSLSVIALVWMVFKHLVGPLKAPLDEDALCLRVEKMNPNTGTSLISALQLDRLNDLADRGYSMEMVANAVDNGGGLAARADFDAVLNKPYRNKRLTVGFIALIAFFVTCLGARETMAIWFQRNLLFMETQWPRSTKLVIMGMKNGGLTLAEGDDLTISVKAEMKKGKTPPAEINVRYRYANGDVTAPQAVGSSGENTFRTVVKGVTESFEFRIAGGDDDTGWVPVTVLPRPTLTELIVTATPPAYTGDPTENLPTDQSVYRLLAGTKLKVIGRASQKLSQITVLAPMKKQGQIIDLNGSDTFELDIETPLQGTYKLTMVNTSDIAAKSPTEMRIRLLADAKPTVRMRVDGISDIVLPRALIPLKLQVQDDYAVVSSVLNVQIADDEDSKERSMDTPLPDLVGKKEQVQLTHRHDLKPLDVKPGAHVMLKVTSTDNDAVTGPKKTTSSTLVLRVVTESEFRDALLRREQALRLDFDQIFAKQKKFLEEVKILRSTTKGNAAGLRKKQQRLNQRVRDLSTSFDAVFVEVMNNRLEADTGPTVLRLQDGIIKPLVTLAEKEMDAAAQGLVTKDFAAAQTAQEDALKRMKAIRKNMVQSETFQLAAKILRGIIERQKDLKKETEKKAEEDPDGIFE